MLSILDKSYLAGAMDADGWFCIKRVSPKPEAHRHNVTYFVFIGFCQVQPEVPNLLHTEFGGSLQCRHQTEKRKGHKSNGWKANYYWTTTSQKACNAIRELMPFLKVKRGQAELCLALQDSINMYRFTWAKKGVKSAQALPQEVIDTRTNIYEKLASLHDNRIIRRRLI